MYQTVYTAVSAPFEKRLVGWIALRMPSSITPNRLTFVGMVGACLCAAGYILSSIDRRWLGLSLIGLLLHWFGDSLDGTVARLRNIERPLFGSYLDQVCDATSVCLILVGMGLSPYVRLDVAALVAISSLALALQAQFRAAATGIYDVAFGGVGGTEARAVMMVITGAMMAAGGVSYTTPFGAFSIFDLIFSLVLVWSVAAFFSEAARTLALLANADPPKTTKSLGQDGLKEPGLAVSRADKL